MAVRIRRSRIVFITRDLPRDVVEESYRAMVGVDLTSTSRRPTQQRDRYSQLPSATA